MLAIINQIIKLKKNKKQAMNHENQFSINFYALRNTDKNFDILSFYQNSNHHQNNHKRQQNIQIQLNDDEINQQKIQQYFNLLFSPRMITQSLIRRNQFLQMKSFDNSDSQHDQLYNRRRLRVNNLKQKENKKLLMLSDIKIKQPQKYQAIAQFMKFFASIKQKINGIRHDYYSQKTFITLKKISTNELIKATRVLYHILNQVVNHFKKFGYHHDQQFQQKIIQFYIEFLIIPRFFISKQKLLKLINDQSIQQNFKFLIYHGCLGHYNNQANKRLPQETQMKYVRQLLNDPNGKQKFKKICTINHGGHFYKKHGNQYYELYFKSLDCLKKIDQLCKKTYTIDQLNNQLSKSETKQNSQKSFSKIIQNIDDVNILNWPVDMTDQKSVSNILKSSVPRQDVQANFSKTVSSLGKSIIIQNNTQVQPTKFKLKRPHSLMASSQTEEKPKLKIKKAFTLQLCRQSNIIIVPPPQYNSDIQYL